MTAAGKRTDYRLTFVVLLLGVTAYALLQSLVTPALPAIQRDLDTTQSAVTWLITGYLLSASICTPILGRIGDAIGKERVLLLTLVALGVGTALAAVASSIEVLIAARLVQGAGGGVLPLSFGIIRDEFPSDRVAFGIGTTASIIAAGSGLGIVLAGPIESHLGYHWLFWFPFVLIVVGTIAAWRVVPPSPVRQSGGVSWTGALLLSGWLVALLLAVSEGPSWGWGSRGVIGLLALAVVTAAVWVVVESRSAVPLVDMRMMRRRAVWTTNLVALLFGAAMYAPMAFLPAFVQTPVSAGYGFGASVTEAGLFMLPATVGMFVLGLAAGRVAELFGSKPPVVLGAVATAFGYGVMAIEHDAGWVIYLGTTLLGIGMGLAFAAMTNLIVDAVPPEQTGVASGMNANIRTVGGSIGSQVSGTLIVAGVGVGSVPPESGYLNVFVFLTVVSAAAAVAALAIPHVRRSGVGHVDHPELALVAAGTVTDPEVAPRDGRSAHRT